MEMNGASSRSSPLSCLFHGGIVLYPTAACLATLGLVLSKQNSGQAVELPLATIAAANTPST